MSREKPINYVSNEELFDEIVKYKKKVQSYKDRGWTKRPKMQDRLGEIIMLIANKLSNRPNFIGYTYKDEMVSDGIENVIKYVDKFDDIKYKNAFAYVTQILFFAFVRRISKEKEQAEIKFKKIEEAMSSGIFTNEFCGNENPFSE